MQQETEDFNMRLYWMVWMYIGDMEMAISVGPLRFRVTNVDCHTHEITHFVCGSCFAPKSPTILPITLHRQQFEINTK